MAAGVVGGGQARIPELKLVLPVQVEVQSATSPVSVPAPRSESNVIKSFVAGKAQANAPRTGSITDVGTDKHGLKPVERKLLRFSKRSFSSLQVLEIKLELCREASAAARLAVKL